MNRKSQVLIISLWILSILTVFAVGIGHRVSMSLRLTRYQRDSLKAYYLAKAGINCAIAKIENDSVASDSLNDPWANNEAAFKKISFNEKAPEFATVSYTMINADNQEERVYGVEDEERKININSATKDLLVSLLDKAGVENPENIADYIVAWRGGAGVSDEAKDYSLSGYQCKDAPFTNLEELLLVKNIDSALFDALRNKITLWGTGKININTADKDTLEAVFSSVKGVDEAVISSVVNTIENYRKGGNPPFTSLPDAALFGEGEELALFNAAVGKFTVTSSAFRIESEGYVRNLIKKISVIYNRQQKKIVYWHES